MSDTTLLEASPARVAPAEPGASLKTWVSVVGCMLGALMAVLDIQITNSSLPNIEGGISTGSDNGTWISTAYLIGEIVMIPLTAFLSSVFGFRRLLLTNTVLFLVFSVGCALSTDLAQMIVMRALQGFVGGVMIPMAFTIVLTKLPAHQQSAGIATFALTATLGPSLGPTLGGYLTDHYGWPYIFLINLVPGAIMLALLVPTLEREPLRLDRLREGDWWGIATLATGLACLQTMLDEGEKDDWFGSPLIVRLAILAALFLTAFVVIELRSEKPAVNLRLLAHRNFCLGTLAIALVGVALYGSIYVLPTYLDQVEGYDAQQIGQVLAWVGLPQLLVIPFVPRLMRFLDARLLGILGLATFGVSCLMNSHLSYDYSGDQFMFTNIVRAVGQAVVLTPLTAIAMVGIAKRDVAAASGISNMMRALGGAVGTAALSTVIAKREQFHSNIIGQSVSPFDGRIHDFLAQQQAYLMAQGESDPGRAYHEAEVLLGHLVARQATVMAYSDTFAVLGVTLLLAAGLILFMRGTPRQASGTAGGREERSRPLRARGR